MPLKLKKLKITSTLGGNITIIKDSDVDIGAESYTDLFDDGFVSGLDMTDPPTNLPNNKIWFSPSTYTSSIQDGSVTFVFKLYDHWAFNRFGLTIGDKIEFFCKIESNQPTQIDAPYLPEWHIGKVYKDGSSATVPIRIFYGWIESVQVSQTGIYTVTCRDPIWRAKNILLVQEKKDATAAWHSDQIPVPFVVFNADYKSDNWFWSIKKRNTTGFNPTYGAGLGDATLSTSVQKMTAKEILEYLEDQYLQDLIIQEVFEGGTQNLFDQGDLDLLALQEPPELVFDGVNFADAILQIIDAYAPNYRMWVDMETLQWRITPYANYASRIADPLFGTTTNTVDPAVDIGGSKRVYFGDGAAAQSIHDDIDMTTDFTRQVLFVRNRGTPFNPRMIYQTTWQDMSEQVYVLAKGYDGGASQYYIDVPLADSPGPGYLYKAITNRFASGSRIYPIHSQRLANIGFDLSDDVSTFEQNWDDEGVYTAVSINGRKTIEDELSIKSTTSAPTTPRITQGWSAGAEARWREVHQNRSWDNGTDNNGIPVFSYTESPTLDQTTLRYQFSDSQYGDDTVDDEWRDCSFWVVENNGTSYKTLKPKAVARILSSTLVNETDFDGVELVLDKQLTELGIGTPRIVGQANPTKFYLTDSPRLGTNASNAMNGMKAVFRKFNIVFSSEVQDTLQKSKKDEYCQQLALIKSSQGVEQVSPTMQPLYVYANIGGSQKLVGGVFPLSNFVLPKAAINPDVSNTCLPGQSFVAPEIELKLIRKTAQAIRVRIPDEGYAGRAYMLHNLERELALIIDDFRDPNDATQQADFSKICEYLFHVLSDPGETSSLTVHDCGKWIYLKDLHFRMQVVSDHLLTGGNTISTTFRPAVESVTFDFESDVVTVSGRALGSILGTGFFKVYENILKAKALKETPELIKKLVRNGMCDEGQDLHQKIPPGPIDCTHGQLTGGHGATKSKTTAKNYLGGAVEGLGVGTSSGGSGTWPSVNAPSASVGASKITSIEQDVYGQWFQATASGAIRGGSVSGSAFTPNNAVVSAPVGYGGQALNDVSGILINLFEIDMQYEVLPVYGSVGPSASTTNIPIEFPALKDTTSYVGGTLFIEDGTQRAGYQITAHTTSAVTITGNSVAPRQGVRVNIRGPLKPVPLSADFPSGGTAFKDADGNWFVATPSGSITQVTRNTVVWPGPDTLSITSPVTASPRFRLRNNGNTVVELDVPLEVNAQSSKFGGLYLDGRVDTTKGARGDGTGALAYQESGTPSEGRIKAYVDVAGTPTLKELAFLTDGANAPGLDEPEAGATLGVDGSAWTEIPNTPTDIQTAFDSVEEALGAKIASSDASVTAGNGLTGGGYLPASLAVGAGDGIAVSADAVSADYGAIAAQLSTVNAGDAAAIGSSAKLPRLDHQHGVATGTPVALSTSAAEGTSTNLSRADHVHPSNLARSFCVGGRRWLIDNNSGTTTYTLSDGSITINNDDAHVMSGPFFGNTSNTAAKVDFVAPDDIDTAQVVSCRLYFRITAASGSGTFNSTFAWTADAINNGEAITTAGPNRSGSVVVDIGSDQGYAAGDLLIVSMGTIFQASDIAAHDYCMMSVRRNNPGATHPSLILVKAKFEYTAKTS